MSKSKKILAPRKFWTQPEIESVRSRYPNEKTADIAKALRRTPSQVYQMAGKLVVKKSPEYLASPAAGRTNGRQGIGSRFKPGLTPWNAGMKGLDIGGKETRFKRGQDPHNTCAIGSYRITKDGLLQRKISDTKGNSSQRWRSVHELVWIEANGAVPLKHIVVFKQDMSSNKLEEITIDRIECISRAELMKRNTVHNLPKEIAELIQLRGAVNRQINSRSKHHE